MVSETIVEMLRDSVFLSQVYMKGRLIETIVVTPGTDISMAVKKFKGMYLMSGRIDDKSIRGLIYDGTILCLIVEFDNEVRKIDENELKNLSQTPLRLYIFEIPEDLVRKYTQFEEYIKKVLESTRKVETEKTLPKPELPTTSMTVPIESVSLIPTTTRMPLRAKTIEEDISMLLRSIGIEVVGIDVVKEHNNVRVYVKVARTEAQVELTHIAWLVVSRLLEIDPDAVTRNIHVRVVSPETVYEVSLATELAKRLALFNGLVLRILLRHGFYVKDVKTKVSPDGGFVELLYSVRSIERVVSRDMLRRLAVECLREVKKHWPGRVRIKLRAGMLTEGSAEG